MIRVEDPHDHPQRADLSEPHGGHYWSQIHTGAEYFCDHYQDPWTLWIQLITHDQDWSALLDPRLRTVMLA
jgi:hypothetical protein